MPVYNLEKLSAFRESKDKEQESPKQPIYPFEELGELLRGKREEFLQINGESILVRGIPEDFKVYLNDEFVCESVFGSLYKENDDLCTQLHELLISVS